MKRNRNYFFNTLFCIVLSGCAVGPNYLPPENCVPDEWIETPCPTEVSISYDDPLCNWWEIFGDPLLNKYISLGSEYNNSLLAAEATIFQARALRQVSASKWYPQINADFNALRARLSKNGPLGGIATQGMARGGKTPSPLFNLYNAFVDASWEIDLFGKIRRTVEASEANIDVAIEQRNDLLVSILAEIVMNYIRVRSAQTKELLIKENIELLEENTTIARAQLSSGYKNALDLDKIEAELASAKADLPDVCAQIYQGIYALSILTGHLPEDLLEEMLPFQPLPCAPFEIAVGMRSDLLLRRPDVRQAERQLAYAVANVGVAVASFFPSVSLFGAFGFDSRKLSNLFQGSSRSWVIDGDISIPLFQGGNLIGNLRANEAATTFAAFTYQQTILKAVQEAESAVVAYSEEVQTGNLLNEAVEKNEQVVLLTNERYKSGLVTVLDVLDSERQLNAAKERLLSSDTAALLNLVSLYKALGGGWETVVCETFTQDLVCE